jgi:hypothetical protein
LRVDSKEQRFTALMHVRDTALAVSQLVEDQLIWGSRLEEEDQSAVLADPGAVDTQGGSGADTVTPHEVKELARKVREVLSRSQGGPAAFQLLSEMVCRFGLVGYRSIPRAQYSQVMAWLQEIEV